MSDTTVKLTRFSMENSVQFIKENRIIFLLQTGKVELKMTLLNVYSLLTETTINYGLQYLDYQSVWHIALTVFEKLKVIHGFSWIVLNCLKPLE